MTEAIARAAKSAFESSQLTPVSERVNALYAIRNALEAAKQAILTANEEDLRVRREK